jgi:hypothetical protein
MKKSGLGKAARVERADIGTRCYSTVALDDPNNHKVYQVGLLFAVIHGFVRIRVLILWEML